MTFHQFNIGLVSISDRASQGQYVDQGIPTLNDFLQKTLTSPWQAHTRLIADEQATIEQTLIELADQDNCELILTTGGTGPAPRDVTPEATLAVAHKVLPGFGERMRAISLQYAPTAILSRQEGVIRGRSLIVNLPGQPKAIAEILQDLLQAIPYTLELISGHFLQTNPHIVTGFRPKSAPPLPSSTD